MKMKKDPLPDTNFEIKSGDVRVRAKTKSIKVAIFVISAGIAVSIGYFVLQSKLSDDLLATQKSRDVLESKKIDSLTSRPGSEIKQSTLGDGSKNLVKSSTLPAQLVQESKGKGSDNIYEEK